MSRRNFTLLLCALFVAVLCHDRAGMSPHPRYVAEAYDRIDYWALERPSRQELVDGAMRGMVGVLNQRGDAHSQYIAPRQAQPFIDEMRQEFGGIGVRIRLVGDPARLMLVGIPEPDSPAARAGVRPNDHVLAIDGHQVEGMDMNEVIDLMRGKVDELLVLRVRRQGEESPVDLRMERAVIHVASVIGDRRQSDGQWRFLLEEEPRVALVRLINFGNKTVEEVRDTLNQLDQQGMQALVLDVRENAGGALDAAVGVSDLFLPDGAPIVETRGRRQVVEDSYDATPDGLVSQAPVVVLVNQNTASASEIVAAALQDNQRAKVGGQRSFGKGTVQRIIPIESGNSYLKLTTSSYWRPSGKNIHRLSDNTDQDEWGVSPDAEFEIKLEPDQYKIWRRWRETRDLTVIDADSGEVLSLPILTDDPQEQPPHDYEDQALLRAVEHLQTVLDAGA